MDTATYNLTACDYCGAAAGVPCATASGRPTINPHAAREKAADAIRAEQPEVVVADTPRFGYVCKSCGGPSPVGVGYAVPGAAAELASAELDACACGYSVRPVADAEYLPGTAPAGHPEHVAEDVTEQADDTAEDVTDTTPVTDVTLPADERPTTEPAGAPAATEAPEDTTEDATAPCWRCGGSGLYAMPNRWLRLPPRPHPKTGRVAPWCFECGGLGRVRYALAG